MELGLTFPLQRFLKQKPPAFGTEPDRRFCWDLHVIDLFGRKCLLAVHCHSRYTFVLFDVAPFQWSDLPGLFRKGLFDSLSAAGFSCAQIQKYLSRTGDIRITRTHGRREVAFLNRAWEDVLAMDLCLDDSCQVQPLLDHAVNTRPSRCVGFEGLGTALERMKMILNDGRKHQMNSRPKVAFLCVHNSCRSQIAEALGRKLAGDVFESFSAGTEPGTCINPDAVRLMKQVHGIDMEQTQHNKFLSDLPAVDIVVTMGCNVQCPALPCSHREDWGLDDPSGQEDEVFLSVIAKIEEKVLDLKHRILNRQL